MKTPMYTKINVRLKSRTDYQCGSLQRKILSFLKVHNGKSSGIGIIKYFSSENKDLDVWYALRRLEERDVILIEPIENS
jgi:hypothetical protein